MVHIIFTLILVIAAFSRSLAKQPHIVLILADDLGWNDIGYHGNKDVVTPNMDRLAAEGIKLENHYVQPMCTPTRSTLMSGKYTIHTGLQHSVILTCQPNGLPLENPTIADQLKSLGYATHMIGKWHLGTHRKEYTPLYRGFDTFLGFLAGVNDYYTHKLCRCGFCAYDLQNDGKPTSKFTGEYMTNLLTRRAENVINNHDSSHPMFMYMAYNAPHSPMQVPQQYLEQFKYIQDETRRTYLAMVAAMDEGIGNMTTALKQNNMWNDTIVIFLADNGGVTKWGGSNIPLRGEKFEHWEGGIRGSGFLAGRYIENQGEINHQLIHVSDWYPTLINLAGGNSSSVQDLDGYDQWQTITKNSPNQRDEILVNIDEFAMRKGKTMSTVFDTSVRSALRSGDWKIITGDPGFGSPTISVSKESVFNVGEKKAVSMSSSFWNHVDHLIDWIDGWYHPKHQPDTAHSEQSDAKNIYLFNIAEDPNEKNDVSSQYPEIVELLLQRLAYYNSTAVPVRFPDQDLNCDPSKFGGFWSPWLKG